MNIQLANYFILYMPKDFLFTFTYSCNTPKKTFVIYCHFSHFHLKICPSRTRTIFLTENKKKYSSVHGYYHEIHFSSTFSQILHRTDIYKSFRTNCNCNRNLKKISTYHHCSVTIQHTLKHIVIYCDVVMGETTNHTTGNVVKIKKNSQKMVVSLKIFAKQRKQTSWLTSHFVCYTRTLNFGQDYAVFFSSQKNKQTK